MPPKPKSEEQLCKDKEKIIVIALGIIRKQGLEGLTMRKLSAKLHMSAANMYNYFYSKDEIYLHILITGFELLHKQLLQSISNVKDPVEQLGRFLRAFVRFGMENAAYYELMFSTQDPKSLEFTHSPAEELARKEKADAMRSFALLSSLVSACLPEKPQDEIFTISTRIACELHGCVHLYHTSIIKEIGAPMKRVLDNLIEHIMLQFAPPAAPIKSGVS